ncbi:MAG: RNA polymerase factor sigma-54 [Nitrospirota bacterium]|nr:RNA polymerase factor sigma-54 [Nitrospirota bacterium]
MKLTLRPLLTQKLVMTPQLQMAIRLLQLSRQELEQAIDEEMMENPTMEEADLADEPESNLPVDAETAPDTADPPLTPSPTLDERPMDDRPMDDDAESLGYKWEEYFAQDMGDGRDFGGVDSAPDELPSFEQTLAGTTSLGEHLSWQLRMCPLSEREMAIGEEIIGNIDDDGYLRTEIAEIATACNAPEADVERILGVIQEFDPAGVGARNLRECLLIQVSQLDLEDTTVEQIVANHLEDLERRRYPQIARALKIKPEEVHQAAKVIEGLEPKPGRPFATTQNFTITPDVYVIPVDGEYRVRLNDEGLPRLRISPYYRKMLANRDQAPSEAREYLDGKLRSALWMIKSIEQRNRTIVRVAESIVRFQREFFDFGVSHLKPLILKQVADDISMHESTISRVTTNKYMHTPHGILELKYFFNSGLARVGGYGEDVSSVSVRETIRLLVADENPTNPLKDQEIVKILRGRNVVVARRTVAKYRTELNIPPSNRRKRPF